MSPTVIAALAQLAVGAGAQTAAALSPAARAERKAVKQDIKNLKTGNFGLSEAEKSQRVAQQMDLIRAQSQASQDALSRQTAASGGMNSGAAFRAQQQIAQGAEQQAGEQGAIVQAMSQAKAQQERADALASVKAKAASNRQQAKNVSDMVAQAAQTAMGGGGKDMTEAYDIAGGGK